LIYVLVQTNYNALMDSETAYNHALDYLYSFVDYSLKHASELAKADFNLDRMVALMAGLADPQHAYPIIHVAGTKGKGSTAALCAAALAAAGYRTGLYISPHLVDFCERIQVDGQPISHADLAALVEEIKPAVARVPFLTTFEIVTALGFLYFARQQVQAAVVEVGLGGRLDATNIITPVVSVITSLSYDHMLVLGDTLGKIAYEKAGIIKPGIPVVSSPQEEEAQAVIEDVCAEREAPLTVVGQSLAFESIGQSLEGQSFALTPAGAQRLELFIPLLGKHQVRNAATAFAALRASGLEVSDDAVGKGFASVHWPGRFEIARREPPVIFDSAHNQDSFANLRETLEATFPARPVYLVFGASEDKNLPGMLAEMKPKIKTLLITRADHPRALDPEQILPEAEAAAIPHETIVPVAAAFARALELAQKDGSIVLSAGSMFVTAEVIQAWNVLHEKEAPTSGGS
jgi:dihydrofolate synthase/folylpolyglutamate synthase